MAVVARRRIRKLGKVDMNGSPVPHTNPLARCSFRTAFANFDPTKVAHLVDNDAWARMPVSLMITTLQHDLPAGFDVTDVLLTNTDLAYKARKAVPSGRCRGHFCPPAPRVPPGTFPA